MQHVTNSKLHPAGDVILCRSTSSGDVILCRNTSAGDVILYRNTSAGDVILCRNTSAGCAVPHYTEALRRGVAPYDRAMPAIVISDQGAVNTKRVISCLNDGSDAT